MKQVLFLMTHTGYSSNITKWLGTHPHIETFDTNWYYEDYETVLRLTSQPHKNKSSLAVFLDVIKANQQLTCRELSRSCGMIYFLDHPQNILKDEMLKHLDLRNAIRYYCYRMRGLYENWLRNPTIWMNWDPEKVLEVQRHFNLPSSIELESSGEMISEEAQDCYERYLKLFKINNGSLG